MESNGQKSGLCDYANSTWWRITDTAITRVTLGILVRQAYKSEAAPNSTAATYNVQRVIVAATSLSADEAESRQGQKP